MPSLLKISLDHRSDEIFAPHQLISGSIELHIDEEFIRVKSLRVKLDGNAFCQFIMGRKSNLEIEDYSNRCAAVYVLGDFESEENIKLGCGTHNFKFSYLIPNGIPYSIESQHGHVRYKMQATLEVARGCDLKAERKVIIGSSFNVSAVPGLETPMDFEEMKSFCSLSCPRGQLIMRLNLPRRGFVLGGRIPITVDLENRSSTNISQTDFCLIRTDTFISNYHQRVEQKIVASDSSEGVRRGKSSSFLTSFNVPYDIPTTSRFCNIYKISYELKFTAKADGFHFSPNIFVPITLGTFENEM